MPRSQNFLEKTGATSGEEPVICMEITHPQLALPQRMARAATDLVIGGVVYKARHFEVEWPGDEAGRPPRAPVRWDNTDKAFTEWIDASRGGKGATVRVFAVMADTPDVVEEEVTCDLVTASIEGAYVAGELGYEDVLSTPALAMFYRPDSAPGIF